MNPNLVRGSRLTFAFTALALTPGGPERSAIAQDPAPPAAKKEDDRLKEMEQVVRSFKLVAIDDRGKETPATSSNGPLHRWTDPTRKFKGGALWVWKAEGRPVAVVGAELYASWSLEFVSVSTGLVKANDGRVRWTPRKAGVEFREIPDAPVPAATEAGRFRQMRDLARQFSAGEHWLRNEGNLQHYALRLLPHPVDRYSDMASGTVDGGIFVCANGTNPEALLLIEARRTGDGPPKWSFAAAAFSHAAVSIKLGSREVWTSPNRDTEQAAGPDDSYYDVLVPRQSSARDFSPREKAEP
jgi:hypothetical protein